MTATATKTRKPATKSKARAGKSPEVREAEMKALEAKQAEALLALTESAAWTDYLRAGRLLRSYSELNTLLILFQCPEATQAAGFQTWKALERNVVKGSKSLKIWGRPYHPSIWVDEASVRPGQPVLERKDGKVKVQASFTRCPTLSVFDVSQTEGKPVPEVASRLTDENADEVEKARAVAVVLGAWLESTGWTVSTQALSGGKNGQTCFETHEVMLAEGLSDTQRAKTLIHEAAHVVLHEDNTWAQMDAYFVREHRGLAEVQAESVAWSVANMLGLDTSAYSTGYVAGWAKAAAKSDEGADIVAVVRTTAKAVRFGVNTLMDVVEGPVVKASAEAA